MLIHPCDPIKIPKGIIHSIPIQQIATAPALGGFYTFDGIELNLLGLNPDSVYYMHQYSFIADIDKGIFLDAINQPITAAFLTSMNQVPVLQGPLPVGAYDNVWPVECFFKSNARPAVNIASANNLNYQEQLIVKLSGRLEQTAQLIALGKANIKLFLSVGILEVADKSIITEWGVR